jgi:predicted phosphodiesterase
MSRRTLLIGDLHIHDKKTDLMDIQIASILKIINKECPNEIIFLGDVLDRRKPAPDPVLKLKELLDYTTKKKIEVVIVRGNHCASNKSDNGSTILSVFDGPYCKIIKHTHICHKSKRLYIPHYENQDKIVEALESAPKGYSIFGHFGFAGCLNSQGDKDFSIGLNKFNNRTYLGHIHKHYSNWNGDNEITVVGTPYSTNFGEEGRICFYGIKNEDEDIFVFKEVRSGPRHLVVKYKELEESFEIYKDLINDKNFSTLLRVSLGKDDLIDSNLVEQLQTFYTDFKFVPMEEHDTKSQSEYEPTKELFSINDKIIENYVDKHNSSLDKEDIMWGLGVLKSED